MINYHVQPCDRCTPAEAACMDCGLPYSDSGFCDLVIPNKAWKIIAPDDGLLCPTCLCRRASNLVVECGAVFRSGPFAKLADELNWYKEQAEATARYMHDKEVNADGLLAILTVLALDGGKRANRALGLKETDDDGI